MMVTECNKARNHENYFTKASDTPAVDHKCCNTEENASSFETLTSSKQDTYNTDYFLQKKKQSFTVI